jgi:hypothetical protein
LRVAILPFRFLTEPLRRAEPLAAVMSLLFVVPALFLRRRPDLLLWVLLLALPPAFVMGMDLANGTRQLEFLRYTLAASPGAYALLAAMLIPRRAESAAASSSTDREHARPQPRWIAHALPAAAVMICVFSLPQAYAETQTPKPDWRPAARLIDTAAGANDAIVFFMPPGPGAGFTGSHYLALAHYCRQMPRPVIFLSAPPDDAVLTRLREASGVWTVAPLETPFPPEYLPADFRKVAESATFGRPTISRWTRGDRPDEPHRAATTAATTAARATAATTQSARRAPLGLDAHRHFGGDR